MLKVIPLWLRVGVLLLLAGSVFLWWWVPQWRAERVMERVEQSLADRDFEAAQSDLRNLFQRHPRQLEAALRLAELLRATDLPAAFSLLEGLHEEGRLPPRAYPDAIILGFEIGANEPAEAMLAQIEDTAPDTPRLMGARAVRDLMNRDLPAAREGLEGALALFPEWDQLRYIRGQLLRKSPSKVDQLRAKEDLLQVADGQSVESVRALFALVDSRNLAISNEDKWDFLGRVLEHPWASARRRLLAHHFRWVLRPDDRAAEVEAAVADLGTSHPVMLAEWMNGIGEHERALELVPAGDLVETDLAAFEQRFRALTLGGKLQEAEALVRDAEVGETAVQRAARLFLVSLRPDNSDEAVKRWNDAYALARNENDLAVQYFLGRSALRLGYLAGAVQAYEGLFEQADFAQSASTDAWMEYFTVTLATGALEEAHAVSVRATKQYPDDLQMWNNRLYIELIGNFDWGDAYARFVDIAPPPAEIRDVNGTGSTWVLSSLLSEKPTEALRQLETIESANPDQPITDSTKVVKALVLAANQRYEEAIRLTNEINRDNVLPAEWALLANLQMEP